MFRIFFLVFLLPALAMGSLEIKDVAGNAALDPSTYKATENWTKLENGQPIFGNLIEFNDPKIFENLNFQGALLINGKEDKKILIVGAKKATMSDIEGNPKYEITWVPEKKGLFYNKCQTKYFNFRLEKKSNMEFPLAVICELELLPPRFTISTIEEVEWVDYPFSEILGKGERTRTFEIPSGSIKNEKAGEFTFSLDGVQAALPVFVKKLGEIEKVQETKSLQFDKTLFIGASSMTYAGTSSVSSQSFMLKFRGLSAPLKGNYRFGTQFKNTFNMSDDPKSITATDIAFSLGYFKNLKETWELGAAGQYRFLDYRQLSTEARVQSSQFGIQLIAQYQKEKNRYRFDFSMANLGSKVVKSHMDIALSYQRKVMLGGIETWMGAEFEMQNVDGADPNGDSQKFGDTSFLFAMSF